MNLILAIMAGGSLGAISRYFAVIAVMKLSATTFPYGTMFVNIMGCFLIGALLEYGALKGEMTLEMRGFLVTGFLGAFTTFSAFSLDFFKLFETGHVVLSIGYALGSVLLSLMAIFIGVYLMRSILG